MQISAAYVDITHEFFARMNMQHRDLLRAFEMSTVHMHKAPTVFAGV
jgi:hypothetical protein